MAGTSFCYADDGRPKNFPHVVSYTELIPLLNDTIPAANKIPETKTTADNSSTVTTIKEVPKAKKQLAPIAVPVQVKPIKIIKPKIIKPVIKPVIKIN